MEIELFIIFFFIILNTFFIYFFNKIKLFHHNLDKPDNKRKLHKKPIPLAGGTLIFLNLLFYSFFIFFNQNLLLKEVLFLNQLNFALFFLSCLAIFCLGFFDDRLNISAAFKFLITTIIIFLIIFFDKNLILNQIKFSFFERIFYLSEFSILFTCFCFIVYLNAFNMFDGINLQSFSYSLIIFFYIFIFHLDVILIQVLFISLITFGYLNFKNKSFLGDSGSLLLSFIISYIFIKLYNFNMINFADEIVIFMLIPGIDLIRLFLIRILNKRNPLSPDRLHLHHLLLSKFSYKETLIIIIILILLPIILNYLKLNNLYTIALVSLLYFLIFKIIKHKKS